MSTEEYHKVRELVSYITQVADTLRSAVASEKKEWFDTDLKAATTTLNKAIVYVEANKEAFDSLCTKRKIVAVGKDLSKILNDLAEFEGIFRAGYVDQWQLNTFRGYVATARESLRKLGGN